MSFLAMIFFPCLKKSLYDDIITVLTGLATSTLLCDAILYLIPLVLEIETNKKKGVIEVPGYVWKLILCIVGNITLKRNGMALCFNL